MQNATFLSVADRSGTPANHLSQIPDEILDSLEWEDVDASAFTGFLITNAEPSPGPEGVTIFLGVYPLIDQNRAYALSVFFSDGEVDIPPAGLHFQRAAIGEAVR